MILILSGEGGTDLGGSSDFGDRVGPMAHLVDQMIEDQIDYSPISCEMVRWVSRSELSAEAKKSKFPRTALPGVRRPPGYVGHYKQAYALGRMAKNIESTEDVPSVSVMFRDSDGTNSTGAGHWRALTAAIAEGYAAAGYVSGVAMIPKPKQESWLLCALKNEPYIGCQLLEDESGNDSSPHSLKDKLCEAIGNHPSVEEMSEWIKTRRFDSTKIEMESFSHFRANLMAALDAVVQR